MLHYDIVFEEMEKALRTSSLYRNFGQRLVCKTLESKTATNSCMVVFELPFSEKRKVEMKIIFKKFKSSDSIAYRCVAKYEGRFQSVSEIKNKYGNIEEKIKDMIISNIKKNEQLRLGYLFRKESLFYEV